MRLRLWRSYGFFSPRPEMLPAIELRGWKAIGPGNYFKSKKLLLYDWILHSRYHISNDFSAWVQFSVWIVWLFGAVWALSHVAVLLGTQAKLIAYVGRVWREFSECVFLKCTHTDTHTLRNGLCLNDRFLASIHTHSWIINACVLASAQWYTLTFTHILSLSMCFTRT